jgi:hypothetical protein
MWPPSRTVTLLCRSRLCHDLIRVWCLCKYWVHQLNRSGTPTHSAASLAHAFVAPEGKVMNRGTGQCVTLGHGDALGGTAAAEIPATVTGYPQIALASPRSCSPTADPPGQCCLPVPGQKVQPYYPLPFHRELCRGSTGCLGTSSLCTRLTRHIPAFSPSSAAGQWVPSPY